MRTAIAIVFVVITAACISSETQNYYSAVTEEDNDSQETVQPRTELDDSQETPARQNIPTQTDPNKPPLKLKTIGVNLGHYDSDTNRAGDFVFTKADMTIGQIFSPYGFVISGSVTDTGQDKVSPQVEFRVPMGTKVRSLVDGVVVAVPELYSGDYSVHVAASEDGQWRYETEHVINVRVKVGDRVTAGQIIAEVSPHDKENYDGLGLRSEER